MKYCLDTDIVIDFLRNDEKIVDAINNLENEELYITYITLCELYKGVYLSNKQDYELKIIYDFINNIDLIDFNVEACDFFGSEYARLSKEGKMTQESDLMIASIAKVNDMVIITRNKKHFENIRTKIEIW